MAPKWANVPVVTSAKPPGPKKAKSDSNEDKTGGSRGRGRGRGKGRGKGKQSVDVEMTEKFSKMNKWQLLETIVRKLAVIAQVHDKDIGDLMAASTILVYIIPEDHPGALSLRNRYTDYIDKATKNNQLAADDPAKESMAAPQILLFQALLKTMVDNKEMKDFSESMLAAVEKELKSLEESEDPIERIPLLRCTKAFSKKGSPKKFKVRIMVTDLQRTLKSAINLFFCSLGGTRKIGVAPRGASIRELTVLQGLLENTEDEEWEDES